MEKQKTINLLLPALLLVCIFVLPAHATEASESDGTIVSSAKYAWGENLGWINFKPTQGGLHITDSAISGYAWSQNDGWINFAPTGGGVLNTSTGQLSGYAWSSIKGWISFSGVSIDNQGRFLGTAGTVGSSAGRINFGCTDCAVQTDWRPLSARTVAAGTSRTTGTVGGYATMPTLITPISLITTAEDVPLDVFPGAAGKVVKNTPQGPITVEIPKGASALRLTLTINITPADRSETNPEIPSSFLLNAAFYDIRAVDAAGNEVHTFNSPLLITLPLPPNLRDIRRLGVYWLNTVDNTWVKIPDAVFTSDHVSFFVTHLTRFAIFATRSTATIREPAVVPSPGGGAIVTEKSTADLLPQNISMERERIVRDRMARANPRGINPTKSYKEHILILSLLTLLSLIAYILARKKATE